MTIIEKGFFIANNDCSIVIVNNEKKRYVDKCQFMT